MMSMKKSRIHIVMFSVLIAVSALPFKALNAEMRSPGEASQSESCRKDPACQRTSWKDEFERLCIQTEIATSLTPEQLQKLINDSDELMDRLEKLPASEVKIFIFRLRNCKNFFVYALELQAADG
jgi:hypothetical protein